MFEINDPRFIKKVTKRIPIKELEKILKPTYDPRGSRVGFMGKDEKLLELVYSDWKIVERYDTTHKKIAKALEYAFTDDSKLNPKYEIRDCQALPDAPQPCPWGCSSGSCVTYYIYRKGISKEDIGYVYEKALGVSSSQSDIYITKPTVIIVTDLHPHLIREHYFFEGKGSPYRADPAFLIIALNLGKNKY